MSSANVCTLFQYDSYIGLSFFQIHVGGVFRLRQIFFYLTGCVIVGTLLLNVASETSSTIGKLILLSMLVYGMIWLECPSCFVWGC